MDAETPPNRRPLGVPNTYKPKVFGGFWNTIGKTSYFPFLGAFCNFSGASTAFAGELLGGRAVVGMCSGSRMPKIVAGLSRAWKEWRSRPSETGPRMCLGFSLVVGWYG